MIESALVSIQNNQNFSIDLDIPAREKWGSIKEKLSEILILLEPDIFTNQKKYLYIFENQMIGDEETLFEIGAYDGSIITVDAY